MRGATYDEFVTMVRESWEIEYVFEGHNYFYQRCWKNDAYEIYVLCDSEIVYHKTGINMDAMAEEILALRIYDGKTAKEAEQGIWVQFEA